VGRASNLCAAATSQWDRRGSGGAPGTAKVAPRSGGPGPRTAPRLALPPSRKDGAHAGLGFRRSARPSYRSSVSRRRRPETRICRRYVPARFDYVPVVSCGFRVFRPEGGARGPNAGDRRYPDAFVADSITNAVEGRGRLRCRCAAATTRGRPADRHRGRWGRDCRAGHRPGRSRRGPRGGFTVTDGAARGTVVSVELSVCQPSPTRATVDTVLCISRECAAMRRIFILAALSLLLAVGLTHSA
jgi:hypothetical protein